jgi:hypothetical protein
VTPPPTAVATALPDLQVVNYNQNQVDAIFEAAPRVTLRGGYRDVWGDATVRAGQLSQTGSFASGDLNRNVALAGAYFRPLNKMRVNLDFERGLSDQVYFRTSLNDYYKARARAQYQATTSLSLQASFTLLNSQNPAPTVQGYFQTQDEALSFFWAPNQGKRFTFSGEYDHTLVHSSILYRSLPFLDTAVSIFVERAHTATSTIDVALPGIGGRTPRLSAGGSLFVSSGTRPTRFYQPLVRFSLPISRHAAWNTEWRWYGMGEEFYVYEGFRTHAFTTGLRLTR